MPEKTIPLERNQKVGVAAVNRALSILEAFTMGNSTMTLTEISKATGLYKSTVLRLLQSLELYGYAVHLDNGHYSLGAKPILLGTLAQKAFHPAEAIMPVLRSLAELTQESATFYIRSGDTRLCTYRVESPRPVRDNIQVGQALPLDLGAAGHVLRAFEHCSLYDMLQSKVKLIYVSYGERDNETAAVASPVFGPGYHLEGALSVSGPLIRFNKENVASITNHIFDAAKNLTLKLSGDDYIFNQLASEDITKAIT